MPRWAAILLAGAAAPLVSGCVAAALPLVAAGAVARQEVTRENRPTVEVLPDPPAASAGTAAATLPLPADTLPPPISEAPPPPMAMGTVSASPLGMAVPLPPAVPSTVATTAPAAAHANALPGEAAPIETMLAEIRNRLPVYAPRGDQPYDDFIRFALQQAERREAGQIQETVMLAGPPLNGLMRMLPCGFLPPAVIIDLDDGTGAGLNLATADMASGVVAPGGLSEGLEQLRQRDIAVIWMTSQPFDRFDAIAGMLRSSGLDRSGADTIVLTRTVSERKQERRKTIAETHCILAIAGDRKADFDELYDYLRNPDLPIQSDSMIGAGWFLAPQPLAAAAAPVSTQP
ncbi:hypothetical protein GV829_05700 [Sphingomonas lacunae]|uniref:Uncharacterized protein n=1 Tax=Sphingomonas lacunae TaxID=2698828 RepID=A0A6M4AUB4_9SPHN|nr:hypothetical protein [Sphingomonas lacunae]QJQ32010.1 hypothetical protein GV829_05700 [Sphingomonas lacunae]